MSTITVIQASDVIANSRADINNNFANLNADKMELSYLDTDSTLSANSDTRVPSQKAVKAYVDAGGSPLASTTQAGRVEIATSAEFSAGTDIGGTGAYLMAPISLLSSLAIPRFLNYALLSEDPNNNLCMGYSDDPNKHLYLVSSTTFRLIDLTNGKHLTRTVTADWAAADNIHGMVIIGSYIYVLLKDTGAPAMRVYRYAVSDLTSSTLMTVAGTALGGAAGVNPFMNADATNLYINYDGGNDTTNTHEISKYSISGTTITYVSTITCGATAANFVRFAVRQADGHLIGCSSADAKLRRYNTSGTLQATADVACTDGYQYFSLNYSGTYFFAGTNIPANSFGISYSRCNIP